MAGNRSQGSGIVHYPQHTYRRAWSLLCQVAGEKNRESFQSSR